MEYLIILYNLNFNKFYKNYKIDNNKLKFFEHLYHSLIKHALIFNLYKMIVSNLII